MITTMPRSFTRSCGSKVPSSTWLQRRGKTSLALASGHLVVATAAAASSRAEPFSVVPIGGDGNCLFRALAQSHNFNKSGELLCASLEGTRASELRASIVEAMDEQRELLQHFTTTPWPAYIDAMRRDGSWGGELELSVAPAVLRSPVHVYQGRKGGPFVPHAPAGYDIISKYGEEWAGQGAPVSVLFRDMHYDALVPVGLTAREP